MACGGSFPPSETIKVASGEYCRTHAEMLGHDEEDEEEEREMCPWCHKEVTSQSSKRGECVYCSGSLVNWACVGCNAENKPTDWPVCTQCGRDHEDNDHEDNESASNAE